MTTSTFMEEPGLETPINYMMSSQDGPEDEPTDDNDEDMDDEDEDEDADVDGDDEADVEIEEGDVADIADEEE